MINIMDKIINLSTFLFVHQSFNVTYKKNSLIQFGAVVNDTANTNNFNTVIIGMIVVILVLVGAAMFAPKK